MEILSYIFFVYLTVAGLVAAQCGWHVAFRVDRFDWFCAKEDIWMGMFIAPLLWPVTLVYKPKLLIDPAEMFTDQYGRAAGMREIERLRNSPPHCGQVIQFRQRVGSTPEVAGEFTFRSAEVEAAIAAKLVESPDLAERQQGNILKWLRQRDESCSDPTRVPEEWDVFQWIADDLVRNGQGEVRCLQCDRQIPSDQLVKYDDHGQPGWNCNRLLCPNGHHLLRLQNVHCFPIRNGDHVKHVPDFLRGR